MAKIHYKIAGVDYRKAGQTQHEYDHQSACGYVRDNVTRAKKDVTCKLCLRELKAPWILTI